MIYLLVKSFIAGVISGFSILGIADPSTNTVLLSIAGMGFLFYFSKFEFINRKKIIELVRKRRYAHSG